MLRLASGDVGAEVLKLEEKSVGGASGVVVGGVVVGGVVGGVVGPGAVVVGVAGLGVGRLTRP